MKIFVAGGNGFLGSHVSEYLEQSHEVYRGTRGGERGGIALDLLDRSDVERVMADLRPDVIINCAGVVGVNANFDNNREISKNLLEAAVSARIGLKRFIMCASAGEYGSVPTEDLPVKETQPLAATQPYPVSKVNEERFVREYADENSIDSVIARIFNPIGANMAPRYLIPGILRQINAIRAGEADKIEVGRLDALRDYIDVDDVAEAIGKLAACDAHKFAEYNIGTGIATNNETLVKQLLDFTNMPSTTPIVQICESPETPLACQADITRLTTEFGWAPKRSISETLKGAVNS